MASDAMAAALDKLQDMIDRILIETGRALKASDKSTGRTIAHAKARFDNFLPTAENSFHSALDDIEWEIVYAKAIIDRDLRDIRAARMAAEKPALRPEQIKAEVDVGGLQNPSNIHALDIKNQVSTQGASEAGKSITPGPKPESQTTQPQPKNQLSTLTPISGIVAVGGQGVSMANSSSAEKNTDLSAMFNGASEGDNPDLANIGFLADNNMPALDIPSTQQNNQPVQTTDHTTSGDVGDQDINMLDLTQDSNALTTVSGGVPSSLDPLTFDLAGETINTDMELNLEDIGLANNESTFDDLIEDLDFGDGRDDGTSGGFMEHGEFDNAFFGLEDA